MHKSGFVNIIGSPNVGKSTLMNALVGERLSIITSKSQTTRHRIMGIVNADDFQIVYSDTPGVLEPNYKLQEKMMGFVNVALSDADVLLFIVDPYEKEVNHKETLEKVNKMEDVPVLLLLNKVDQMDQEDVAPKLEYWQNKIPRAEVAAISALHRFNLDLVLERIKTLLPEGEPFFPKDAITDKPMRFFMTEIIREKILQHYKKEIPYSVEIAIEEYKEEEKIVRIRALIYCERDSQKFIIIGNKGNMLKKVGTEARKDMEAFIGKKVFLETYVKVDKDWRSKENRLKYFGYNN